MLCKLTDDVKRPETGDCAMSGHKRYTCYMFIRGRWYDCNKRNNLTDRLECLEQQCDRISTLIIIICIYNTCKNIVKFHWLVKFVRPEVYNV